MMNEYPELNRELLTKVVDHALSAENWDQRAWAKKDESTACGTSYCIAGFVVFDFMDHKPKFKGGENSTSLTTDGRYIAYVARSELGLTAHEADELFAPYNKAEGVIAVRDAILAGEYRNS